MKSVLVRASLLRRTFFSFFQLWRLAILVPVGVQRHNVPHFKGLIELYLDLRSSRAWHHFYLPPRPKEKGHFTPKTSYCPIWFAPYCMLSFESHLTIIWHRQIITNPFYWWTFDMTVECITGSITDAAEDNTLCYDMCMTWSKMETIAAPPL